MSRKNYYSAFDGDLAAPVWPLSGTMYRAAKFAAYSSIAWFDRLTLGARKPAVKRHEAGNVRPPTGEAICIYAHYDRQGCVDDYVVYALQKLRELGSDIVFVSTAPALNDDSIAKLSPICAHIVVRENRGYDFGSWKLGFEFVPDLSAYRRLILANDSFYGPLHDLAGLFSEMTRQGAEVWGVTDSYELTHHLQSYFIVFERAAMENQAFADYWRSLPYYRCKRSIIRDGEVGLSTKLSRAGLRLAAAYGYGVLRKSQPEAVGRAERQSRFAGPCNPTRSLWDLLLRNCGCPVLKVDVLRDNPKASPAMDDWRQILAGVSDYDPHLIERHLARVRGLS